MCIRMGEACPRHYPMGWAVLWYALLYDISSLPCRPSGGCMPAKTMKQSEDVHNPYGYSEMDWAAQLDPAYAAARAEVRRLSVGEEGTLSVKVKELIVLGILASRGLQYGVETHMRRALDYGATKEELFEAIKAAAVPGGGVAYSVGEGVSHVLDLSEGSSKLLPMHAEPKHPIVPLCRLGTAPRTTHEPFE